MACCPRHFDCIGLSKDWGYPQSVLALWGVQKARKSKGTRAHISGGQWNKKKINKVLWNKWAMALQDSGAIGEDYRYYLCTMLPSPLLPFIPGASELVSLCCPAAFWVITWGLWSHSLCHVAPLVQACDNTMLSLVLSNWDTGSVRHAADTGCHTSFLCHCISFPPGSSMT